MNAEMLQSLIMIGCGAVVFIYCLIRFCIKGKSKNQRFIEKAKADGCNVQGRCVGTKRRKYYNFSKENQGDNTGTKVTYEYKVSGKTYYKSCIFENRFHGASYPDTVRVYYAKHNPKKSVIEAEASKEKQMQGGCLLTVVITICAMKLVLELLKRLM